MDKTGYTNYAVYITRSLSVARMIGKSIINDTGNDSTVTVSYGEINDPVKDSKVTVCHGKMPEPIIFSDVIPPIYQTKGYYCCVVRYDQQPEPSYEIIFA